MVLTQQNEKAYLTRAYSPISSCILLYTKYMYIFFLNKGGKTHEKNVFLNFNCMTILGYTETGSDTCQYFQVLIVIFTVESAPPFVVIVVISYLYNRPNIIELCLGSILNKYLFPIFVV